MYILTLALLLVSVILCFSKANPVLGRKFELVDTQEFSFIVSIQLTNYKGLFLSCGGALITRKHILTAAHCLQNPAENANREFHKPDEIFVKIGNIEHKKAVLYRLVSYITFDQWAHMHHKQAPNNVNDIAILTLEQEVNQPGVTPGHLTEKPSSYFIGKIVTLVGWGKAPNLDGSQDHLLEGVTIPNALMKTSSHLRKAPVNVLSPEECRIRIKSLTGEWIASLKTQICTTAEPFAIISRGDCGTPLMYGNEIIGINGIPVKPKGFDGQKFYHRDELNSHVGLDHYREFIRNVLSQSSL